MSRFSCIVVGNESLLVRCSDMLLQRGHRIAAVVTRSAEIRAWALGKGLKVEHPGADLAARLDPCDWLFSIANLSVIPPQVLALASAGAVNFHDGPLPRYAGLNSPVWALLNGEPTHGVTWHLIGGEVDEGAILDQRLFDIAEDETALTLNMKCYAAATDGFGSVVAQLEAGRPQGRAQDLSQRTVFARGDRPAAAARLDFSQGAEALLRLVRALDHGSYWNPLARPKIVAGGRVLLVGAAEPADLAAEAAPGTVLAVGEAGLTVATGTGPVRLLRLTDTFGVPALPGSVAKVGDVLPSLDAEEAKDLTEAMAKAVAGESHWRRALQTLVPAELPELQAGNTPAPASRPLPLSLPHDRLIAALGILAARLAGKTEVDLAFHDGTAPTAPGVLSTWVPLRISAGDMAFGDVVARLSNDLAEAGAHPAFALDLIARDPQIAPPVLPAVGLSLGEARLVDGTAMTLGLTGDTPELIFDTARLSAEAADRLAARLICIASAVADPASDATPAARLPILPGAEREQVLHGWNATDTDYDRSACLHYLVEAQAARTPDATALVFEAQSLTYAQLNAAANRAAHVLREMGVRPGTLVGLHTRRSPGMVIGALAILKAGGAYVPMDPAFPRDRIALYIEDSAASVIVTQSDLQAGLPAHAAQVLALDTDARLAAVADTNPDTGVTSADLAYMIYTSGSTGRPKGVMIEHRNVANFFAGMDERLAHEPPGTWLAVTSLSFDISVLELFWTLARGFKLVLSSDADRALVSGGSLAVSDAKIEFSLFYWGNDDGVGPKKYELLLEGAKFADRNGFCAVWTPERHFHAFGGPYPNPSVTGAAVAAVTQNLAVRAGSCVAPLHHTARIAEEWAVIDNLTNGRAGLAIASGWQPDDFVLRPENTPPANKPAMFRQIEDLRRLWRGEAVEFPTANGTPFAVVTQPRPVSKTLPIWVTTAGNPDTWREAGSIGANVLTHLLGQSIDEVAGKIGIYHQALRDAGHDPADHKVTLMLHSFVAGSREAAREIAREPMKDYLRSAAALIKQYAWAFPAFKRPAGVANPFQLDLGSLTAEEMEGILDFAFQRYFEESGLFGTVEDCVARVEDLKRIGVDEIACLIDYGIPVATVLDGLRPLAEVLRRSNAPTELAEDDFSIAAQIVRHGVTHLQCTPSMARMIALSDEARIALGRVKHLMIGGEALPGSLVAEFGRITAARVENMYGPTETTIWSMTETATAEETTVNIGRPIANTQVYVLDANGEPAPVGVAGELYIAGDGVARGYWERPDLTAERFLPNPFAAGRMYRTGDLARWRADGKVDFLGRADHQVKIRGYRIELGEIEARLETAAPVRQAVVLAREDTPGDVRLVAYITTHAPTTDAVLREHLAAALPDYMVPVHFVTLSAFPLTPNKKVDRNALPAPSAVQLAPERIEAFTPPASDIQSNIAAIWSRILGVPQIGARDNFFALGGHSLLAVQAHREIRDTLGISRLTVTDIFRFPTLAGLAAHLGDRPAAIPEPANLAERAQARNDAMSKRRAMRAARGSAGQ